MSLNIYFPCNQEKKGCSENMAMRCDNCNKGTMMGHRVSHSKRRTNHGFRPNLQKKTIMADNGKRISMKLCTNCIKLLKMIDKDKKAALAAKAEKASVPSVTA